MPFVLDKRKVIVLLPILPTQLEAMKILGNLNHRDLEQMEPKVISLTPSEGGKLVILLTT
jgi:hypothetical protein